MASAPHNTPVPASGGGTGGGGDDASVGLPSGATEYQRYVAKRDEVEARIKADPTILFDNQIRALYSKLHATMTEVRKRAGRGKPISPDDVVTQRLIEAQTFKETAGTVDELHKLVFRR